MSSDRVKSSSHMPTRLKGKMREKVENAKDDIKMSKFLATIRTDVPIEPQPR